MMHKFVSMTLGAILIAVTAVPANAAAPLAGKWTNPKGSVVIQMAPCGRAWCGRVVSASAKARADAREGGTPNLIGKNLLSGLRPDGKGGWIGRVFLPKRNMHATGTIRPIGAGAMSVKGCALAGIVCKEQRWRRVG